MEPFGIDGSREMLALPRIAPTADSGAAIAALCSITRYLLDGATARSAACPKSTSQYCGISQSCAGRPTGRRRPAASSPGLCVRAQSRPVRPRKNRAFDGSTGAPPWRNFANHRTLPIPSLDMPAPEVRRLGRAIAQLFGRFDDRHLNELESY
jgi:hypothetical protein